LLIALFVLAAAIAWSVSPARAQAAEAIIDNGTVQLGVNDIGDLNVGGGTPSSGTGTTSVGLRYIPTGAEATAPGCLCEGWGAADATSGVSGYANVSVGTSPNLSLVSFTSTASTAVSVVDILDSSSNPVLRVTQDYHPATGTSNLYEVAVTIENRSASTVDARYRRVMDWDVEPTAFSEFVTINGGTSTALLFDSDNGFASADPLNGPSDIGNTGNFADAGPDDHGALFDFGFGALAAGESKTFKVFYGAAGTESDALAALGAVGAEVYSLGQPSTADGPTLGTPNTFVFAFAGVGGAPIGATSTATTYAGDAGVQYSDAASLSGKLEDTTVSPAAGIAGKQLDFTLGSQTTSASPTDSSGAAGTSLVVTQKPGSVSSVGTSFAGDSSYLTSSDSDPFAITKEDCTLSYTGDILVLPTAMTTLSAHMGEPDSSLGDRSGKQVTFSLVDSSLATTTVTASTDSGGDASTTQALAPGVYGVAVSFAGDDWYLPCGTPTDTLVTVQAAGAKVTGGGWISTSSRSSFGFNVIPIAGSAWKGQFQLRSNNGKAKFHGNTAQALVVSGTSAKWNGTGRWNGLPNYRYYVEVVDNGSSGSKKGDTIKITVKKPAGNDTVVYSSGSSAIALKGGNITIH
jgi:hypothetical protein